MAKQISEIKLLLLCDAPMNINTGGIAQTLYNILYNWDPKNILCITSNKEIKLKPPTEPFNHSYIGYDFDLIHLPPNRISQKLQPYITSIELSINKFRKFNSIKKSIADFKPDIAISCSNSASNVIMHEVLLSKLNIPVIPYFMDDWMYTKNVNWFGGSIYSSVKKILADNKKWMMISDELSKILEERYNIKPQKVLSICNAVDITDAPFAKPLEQKTEYVLAYAGALWPIHFDAVVSIAKAIKIVNDHYKINVKFVFYMAEIFWDLNKQILEPLGSMYGGKVPYKTIHQKLSEADLLLLPAAFGKEMYTLTKGSLQTKVMDYLKARKLILACGPNYSANNNFIKKHQCGVCIETNDENKMAEQLVNILSTMPQNQVYINNGWQILKTDFSIDVIQQKFQNFIQDCIQ